MIPVTFDEWHEVFRTRTFEGLDGLHVHAFSDDAVMAGNGTIGLEIVEDLPDVDAVVAPYGGGGLSCGIASALRAVAPSCKVFAAEVATAAPLAPSLEAGQPVKVEYTPSFVDGIGSPEVFPEMFELAQRAPGRLARRRARRGRRRRPAPRRAGARRRRGRGRDGARSRPHRSGGQRQGRLRRLGREHRLGEAGRDPRRLTAHSPSDTCTRSPPNSLCTGSQGKKMTTRNSTRSPDAS